VDLYSGGLIFGWAYIRGGAYIWNEGSVSTCGGFIHGGGAYSRRFTVLVILCIINNLPGVVHGHFLVKYYT
jgi:hypothetical protein